MCQHCSELHPRRTVSFLSTGWDSEAVLALADDDFMAAGWVLRRCAVPGGFTSSHPSSGIECFTLHTYSVTNYIPPSCMISTDLDFKCALGETSAGMKSCLGWPGELSLLHGWMMVEWKEGNWAWRGLSFPISLSRYLAILLSPFLCFTSLLVAVLGFPSTGDLRWSAPREGPRTAPDWLKTADMVVIILTVLRTVLTVLTPYGVQYLTIQGGCWPAVPAWY